MVTMRRLLGVRRKVTFCTTATPNFLPMAAVLINSIRATYGDRHDIHLLILSADRVPFEYGGAKVTYAVDLPGALWDKMLRYDPVCRGVSFKPAFVRQINSLHHYDVLFHLDADTELFGRLDEAEEALHAAKASVLLSPHSTQPRFLGKPIDDRAIVSAGAFNAGFFAVNNSREAFAFLDWWSRLNETECTMETGDPSRDQKWLTLAPCYFAGTRILRHPGYNVAHFNVDERADVFSNGELRFFHYTMLHQFEWDVSTYIGRLQLSDNPALIRALHRYVDRVRAKQREIEARFGIEVAAPGLEHEDDTPPPVREAYRRMFPQPKPIASREECDDLRRQLAAVPAE